eukprot:2930441-Rhodomonas_salina.1
MIAASVRRPGLSDCHGHRHGPRIPGTRVSGYICPRLVEQPLVLLLLVTRAYPGHARIPG